MENPAASPEEPPPPFGEVEIGKDICSSFYQYPSKQLFQDYIACQIGSRIHLEINTLFGEVSEC